MLCIGIILLRTLNVAHLKRNTERTKEQWEQEWTRGEKKTHQQRGNIALCCNKRATSLLVRADFNCSLTLYLCLLYDRTYSSHSTNTCWIIQYFTMFSALSLSNSRAENDHDNDDALDKLKRTKRGEAQDMNLNSCVASCMEKIHWVLTHTELERTKPARTTFSNNNNNKRKKRKKIIINDLKTINQ